MPFPPRIRNEAFVACKRSCCICHRFKGIKIELHHIVLESEGGRNDYDNAIPVCFDCHADMRSYDSQHPRGSKYSPEELKMHRNRWYQRVASSPVETYTAEASALDKALYQEIIRILPYDRAVLAMRTHVFAAPYRIASLKDLYDFAARLADPAFEFIDADLETQLAELSESVDECINALDENTFADDVRPEIAAVPKEWRTTQRESFYNAVHRLERAGNRMGAAYDALVRSGRRKLHV